MRWLLALVFLGCSSPRERTPVRVFAAASLTDAFKAVEAAFETEHPTIDVQVTTAGSQILRMQIEHGAQADLFVSANADHVGDLIAAGRLSLRSPFVRNRLVLLVSDGSPVRQFADWTAIQRLVIGQPKVPIGAYTQQVFERLGPAAQRALQAKVVSEENNARQVRAKVALGEADAAFVYATDAQVSGARAVQLPDDYRPFILYHLGWPSTSTPAAQQFLDFLRSASGQAIFTARGFVP